MYVELQPAADVDLSLYAYSTGASGAPRLPPDITTAVSCEASYRYGETNYNVDQNPGKLEKVNLNAIANPYNVVIGVAGPRKATRGSFTLKVILEGGS